jgi:hypothetical protein
MPDIPRFNAGGEHPAFVTKGHIGNKTWQKKLPE